MRVVAQKIMLTFWPWWPGCERVRELKIIPLDSRLLQRGLDLLGRREDKNWSLTDCISFVVMEDEGLHDALTTDRHFEQAGLKALLA